MTFNINQHVSVHMVGQCINVRWIFIGSLELENTQKICLKYSKLVSFFSYNVRYIQLPDTDRFPSQ